MKIQEVFLLLLILTIAVIMDIRTRKIKNWLIITGLLSGFLLRILSEGREGALNFLAGCLIPIFLLFVLFLFRVIGAGDVKLIAVTGGFLGTHSILRCIITIFILSACFALIKILKYHNFMNRMQYLADYVSKFIKTKKIEPYYQESVETEHILYMSVFIFLSVILHLGGIY